MHAKCPEIGASFFSPIFGSCDIGLMFLDRRYFAHSLDRYSLLIVYVCILWQPAQNDKPYIAFIYPFVYSLPELSIATPLSAAATVGRVPLSFICRASSSSSHPDKKYRVGLIDGTQ